MKSCCEMAREAEPGASHAEVPVRNAVEMRKEMKVGVVCEGGANRTVFACGVMDVLLDENIMPDYYVGVSAGIAFGVSYLAGQRGRNIEVVEKYMTDKRYMGMRHLLNKSERAYYNTKFVFEEVPGNLLPFDYDAFAAYPGKVEAVVTGLHSGRAAYLEVPRGKEMRDTLVASCSLPVLFQPVKIGNHYYLDGGLSDSIPFLHALEEGCERVIVILTREWGYVKKTGGATRLTGSIYRQYPHIVEALKKRAERYNASMEQLKQFFDEGKVFVIAPNSTHGVGRVDRDLVKLRRLYDEGIEAATKNMTALRQYLGS